MIKRLFASFLLLLTVCYCEAQDTLVISDNLNARYIGQSCYQYQDSNRHLSIFDLVQSSSLFQKSKNDAINFGVNDFNNWIRFTLKNNSQQEQLVLNLSYPTLDSVELYILKDNTIDSCFYSDNLSLKNRKYQHPFFVFDIPIRQGERATCFIKLKSNKQIIAPIKIENAASISSSLSASDTISGLYLGVMIAMILYNLFVYFSAKDRHYIYYCNYIFWVLITQAALMGFLHIFPFLDDNWFSDKVLTFAAAMSGIATIIFVKSFLQTKINAPKYVFLLNLIIVGDLLAILLLLAGSSLLAYQFVNLTAGLGSLIVLFVAIRIFQKKHKSARYFLFGWTFFLGSVIIFVLKDIGLLPYNIFTIRSVQIGSVIEAMLLSFALADKLNILKKEKEISQAAALEAAKENERIIKEQNKVLEQKVEERTHELSETNTNLHKTLDDLKQAQSQLVEAEKMASLGQLTAGIAHEINNPINFVTSNVAPLKRDVGMVFDTIDFIEKTGFEDISAQDKKAKIAEYKEELDYDYLKVEINHLLNGIYEGSSRTAEIVKGLRIFSRVDENDLKRADINEGIDSTLIIVNNLLNSNIEIKKEYADPLPMIECYPGKLNQVFLNIITNAIHAIRQKYGDKTSGVITIRTKSFDDYITVEFLDNGIGMDEMTQHKIYEPFFTTKEVGEGTGLGMSIVYNTIKKHNGTIKLVSKVGEGTSFIIRLPIIFQLPQA